MYKIAREGMQVNKIKSEIDSNHDDHGWAFMTSALDFSLQCFKHELPSRKQLINPISARKSSIKHQNKA